MKQTFALILVALLLMIVVAEGVNNQPIRNVVLASEITARIQNGEPVDYDYVIVRGDINLDLLNKPSIIKSKIGINRSEIDGNVFFNGSKFKGEVYFSNSIFKGSAYFGDSIFNRTAYFRGSTFDNHADFQNTTFDDYANFVDSTFNSTADFQVSAFKRHVDFRSAAFNDYASFRYGLFKGNAYFFNSAFNGTADFQASAFRSLVDFRSAAFNSYAYFGEDLFEDNVHFSDSLFNGPAYFSSIAFKGNTYFIDSAFNSTADFTISNFNGSAFFENTMFRKEADFSNVKFNGDVSFNNSRFYGNAIFEKADFSGVLYLTRTRYDNLYIRWANIRELGSDEASYLILIENFKRLGYFDDANDCYNQYKALSNTGTLNPLIPVSILLMAALSAAILIFSYKAYRRKAIVADFKDSLDRISKAEPRDVQEIAASQITLLGNYYEIALDQAQKSFIAAFVAAVIGLIFFLVSVVFLVFIDQIKLAMIGVIGAAITEVISGINFYLYNKSASQLVEFLKNLNMTQRFLLANSICEGLEGDYKQQARSDLVRAIAGAGDSDKGKI
jgi:hypothetical protein